jgi:hypothetical protein
MLPLDRGAWDDSTSANEANANKSSFRNLTGLAAASALAVGIGAAALSSQIAPAVAAERGHWRYWASVSTYMPMADFNHVVGPTRFVGYFLAGPDRCRVTVFMAAADDEALVRPPRRFEFDVAAGGRNEIPAGGGSALAIACTADADAIKVAPQQLPMSAGNLDGVGRAQRAPL